MDQAQGIGAFARDSTWPVAIRIVEVIAVHCSDRERESASRFFDLFKTSWEFYVEGKPYEVLISTLGDLPDIKTGLLILYSADTTPFDLSNGTCMSPVSLKRARSPSGGFVPIYDRLSSLQSGGVDLLIGDVPDERLAVRIDVPGHRVIRVGYDLFRETAILLSQGQPHEFAHIPTLDMHIEWLRTWIVEAGITLVEIPPIPWGHSFFACLTHDVDSGAIRGHGLGPPFWGFMFRATLGSVIGLIGGRLTARELLENWKCVASLPLVYLGILKDPWDGFEEYVRLEDGLSSTFFVLPFRGVPGEPWRGQVDSRRASAYGISDINDQIAFLIERGHEVGLHGIDAWADLISANRERQTVVDVTGQDSIGIRVHWLWYDETSPRVLEQAGFDYDATLGYNSAVGYRSGTAQPYLPFGATSLFELPLHIQDTALFLPRRLNLSKGAAWLHCAPLIANARRQGGVVVVLWHDRSLAPERLWGDFYQRLIHELEAQGAWFGTAREVVRWFRKRRSVVFESACDGSMALTLHRTQETEAGTAPMVVRIHNPPPGIADYSGAEAAFHDIRWDREPSIALPMDSV